MPDDPAPIFEIYVNDDRYAVPTLHLVAAEDEAGAREIMDRLLRESAHHVGAELCLDDRVLFRAGAYAVTPRARPSRGLGGLQDPAADSPPSA
ncbi:hypothetical protein [Phenylobacterium sp.]|jgi:hypothetical protein|uniref:hypothetical protein n=1 Tax=Phenylobacterium sp. TaxID=1871053 RepID=UPI002F42E9BC